MNDELEYIEYPTEIRLAPPSSFLKKEAYKGAKMREGLTSAAQIFFLKARMLYAQQLAPEQGNAEMLELERVYSKDKGSEKSVMEHARMWAEVAEVAKKYAFEPSIENGDKFYAAVYGLQDDWRLKRKVD